MRFLARDIVLTASAFFAGAINSLAGGGTLLTYPALLATGISPIHANATSTFSLVPGALAAFWGYRKDVVKDGRLLAAMALPSLLGSILGAVIVLDMTEHSFARVVPWLILGATALFIFGDWINRRLRNRPDSELTGGRFLVLMALQLGVATYGGFFGAGMGILMLATLGLVGLRNLDRMNGMKSFAAACINGIATVTFVIGHRIEWHPAVVMAVAAIFGGYAGALGARRVGQRVARRAVVAIGFIAAAISFWKALSS